MSPVPLVSVCFWPCAVCGQVLPYKDRGMEGQGLPLAPNIREAARLLKKYKRMGQSCLSTEETWLGALAFHPAATWSRAAPPMLGKAWLNSSPPTWVGGRLDWMWGLSAPACLCTYGRRVWERNSSIDESKRPFSKRFPSSLPSSFESLFPLE